MARPVVRVAHEPHHERRPTVARITAHWRERWLELRLAGIPATPELDTHALRATLLSARFPVELAAERAGGVEIVYDEDTEISEAELT